MKNFRNFEEISIISKKKSKISELLNEISKSRRKKTKFSEISGGALAPLCTNELRAWSSVSAIVYRF
jgi:hypothetical protein